MKRSRADRREHGRWVPLARARLIPPTAEQIEIRVRQGLKLCPDLTEEQVRSTVAGITATAGDLWANDRYQVHVIRWEPLVINGRDAPVIQLSIRRLDRAPARDWRDLQRIKNQLVGDRDLPGREPPPRHRQSVSPLGGRRPGIPLSLWVPRRAGGRQ
jgi:hypothetical protein